MNQCPAGRHGLQNVTNKKPAGKRNLIYLLFVLVFYTTLTGCASNRDSSGNPHKFSADELKEDADVLWQTFQKSHPSLYWYTAKDSVDASFNSLPAAITDSMTEAEFRRLLAERVALIKCGHTSIRSSKASARKHDYLHEKYFPLQVKTWAGDSMVVLANAFNTDTVITRGTVIHSINGLAVRTITDSICKFISADGWHNNFRYQLMSNNFPVWYKSIYGLSNEYNLEITTVGGQNKTVTVKNFDPKTLDSARVKESKKPGMPLPKKKRFEDERKLTIDTARNLAIMELNSFSGGHLPSFFKSSFKTLRKNEIKYLAIELRENGGGNIINSTKLTRYLTDHPFKVADTVAAVGFKYPFPGAVKRGLIFRIQSWFVASKRSDGRLHYRLYEKKYFTPYAKNHFDGNVYIITGGFTFSASTLFISPLIGQHNIKIVGEETGGDAYGNTAVNIPDIVLPNTRLRVRLPLYRIVVNKNLPHDGRGIMPDIIVPPTSWNLAKRIDPKMTKVYQLISLENKKTK